MKLHVRNISFDVTEPQLRAHFEQLGTVIRATLIIDRETQRSKGYGFVEMADSDAEYAIKELSGQPLLGRNIYVEQARERPREERTSYRPSRESGPRR